MIAVGVRNAGGEGGLNPEVNLEITGQATKSPWARSLFNGLAEVIVPSTTEAGQIKLTASGEGLHPATGIVTTQAGKTRPSVP